MSRNTIVFIFDVGKLFVVLARNVGVCGARESLALKMGKNDWRLVCFFYMANTMSYFDLVGDDCMERIMEASADQLEESIDSAVKKLRKYAEARYKEETKVNKGVFSMNRFSLAISCKVLKTA